MNRKPWPILVGIILVLALAAAALLGRPRPAAPLLSPSPTLLVSPSPSPSPTVYRLPSTVYPDLPTITPPAPGEPTVPAEALAMRAAPTATPGTPPTLTPLPTSTPTQTPQPTPIPVPVGGTDDVPMVEVPVGKFLMGIDPATALEHEILWQRYTTGREVPGVPWFEAEIPQLTVSLPAFFIDYIQVTNARYRHCVQMGICGPFNLTGTHLPDDYLENPVYDEYPASVTWEDANAYCQWVGKRLPTEAEWEKAARGTDGRTFPWGEKWDENWVAMTLGPVGRHPEGISPYGVLDMVGNLPEWTLDVFAFYPGHPRTHPTSPAWAVRGGYPASYGQGLGATTTTRLKYSSTRTEVGFRCVRGVPPIDLVDAVTDYQPVVPILPTPQSVDLSNMVYVPAGEFIMGASSEWTSEYPEWHESEYPQHVVYLGEYYIDEHEVTNADYVAFLNALSQNIMACYGHKCASIRREEDIDTSYRDVRLVEYPGTVPLYRVAKGYERYPVVRVSWYGAQAYCAWVGKRLPTEAEWEKAARGTDGRRYPWGDTWDVHSLANAEVWELFEIGSDPLNVSPYGAIDMLGNAGEWVLDWADPHYYALSPYRNPMGPVEPPSEFQHKVYRSPAGYSARWAVSARGSAMPLETVPVGFRCAYSIAPLLVDIEP